MSLLWFLLTAPRSGIIFRSSFGTRGHTMSANHRPFARSRRAHHLLVRWPALVIGVLVLLLAQVGAGAAPGRTSTPYGAKGLFSPMARAQATTLTATHQQSTPRGAP